MLKADGENEKSQNAGPSDLHSNSSRKKIKSTAAASALALWILSILFGFSIPVHSPLVFLADAFLLAGFLPLLWICPYSLLWLAFGLLTTFIGFFLLLLSNIPNAALPADTHAIKQHLLDYHPCWTWMIAGILVAIAGAVKLLLNIFIYFGRRK